MSQENVEVVKAAIEAWNAEDVDGFGELLEPGIVMHAPEGWPEPGPFVGREAAMHQFEQLRETWAFDALEVIGDFIDGGDRVAARVNWRGAGQGPEMCWAFGICPAATSRYAGHIRVRRCPRAGAQRLTGSR
jgi:ketosteroid isomerase-like protein